MLWHDGCGVSTEMSDCIFHLTVRLTQGSSIERISVANYWAKMSSSSTFLCVLSAALSSAFSSNVSSCCVCFFVW